MEVDSNALTAVAAETERALARIWDRVGTTSGERSAELASLQESVRAMFDAKVAEQQAVADSLAVRISEVHANSLSAAIACYGPDSSEVTALNTTPDSTNANGGADGTLRDLLAAAENKQRAVETLRQDRSKLLSERFAQLYKQWKLLGGSDADAFARQFDPLVICSREERERDLTESRLEQYSAAITTATTEAKRRLETVTRHSHTVMDLWAELKCAPAPGKGDELDTQVASQTTDAATSTIAALEAKIEQLRTLRKQRQDKIQALAVDITALWDLLKVADAEREQFFERNTGLGPEVINACESELSQREKEKRAQLKELITEMRETMAELWTELCTSEGDRRADFPAAFAYTDRDYTDAALAAHDVHIGILEKRVSSSRQVIKLIRERDEILKEKEDLDAARDDPDRLKDRRAGLQLLRETKMRDRIQKRLPRIQISLKSALQSWEATQGDRFKYEGRDCLEEIEDIEEAEQAEDDARKLKAQLEREARKAALGISSKARAPGPAQAARSSASGTPQKLRRALVSSKTTPAPVMNAGNAPTSNGALRRSATSGTTARAGQKRAALSPKNAQRIAIAATKNRQSRLGQGAENRAVIRKL